MSMQQMEVKWGSIKGLPEGVEGFLSPAEAEHFNQLRFAARRQSYLLGRLAGKQLLLQQPEFASREPLDITIANDPFGMPFALVQGKVIPGSLSLSHSGDLGVSAYTSAPIFVVGVDTEALAPRSAGLVRDFFTPQEAALIAKLPEAEQTEWVNRLWSAKEATLKANRVGLRVDTCQVEILPGGYPVRADGWQTLQVQSQLFQAGACQVFSRCEDGFVISLAVLSPKEQIEAFIVNIKQELLEVPSELCEMKE
jgi:4'-phosphopantetheinyl transferase